MSCKKKAIMWVWADRAVVCAAVVLNAALVCALGLAGLVCVGTV